MAGPKPPPRTLEPDDERKVQLFLERAAPIVLAEPVIDAERWQQLAQLAAELELTSEQLRQILDDLCQRGVLRKVEIPVPQPPPLPTSAARRPDEATLDDTPENSFSLTPPPPLPVRPRRAAEERALTEKYLRKAAAILARNRGGGPQAQIELLAAARDLGLGDEQARQALQRLRPPEPPREDKPAAQVETEPTVPQPAAAAPVREEPVAQAASDKSPGRKRWRVDGEAAPAAPPPPQEPAVIFRDYARLALDQTRETTISAELEQRLVSHGVAALGLSNVYARHLLQEVAAEKERSLEKESASGGGSSTSAEQTDPQLQAFLNDIAPILAEQRGITAKSRMLLSARARERGLSDEQMNQALALLQRRPDNGEETLQRERLAAFRQYVMAFVNKLPQAFLTASVEQTLTEQGRLAYGVPSDRARAVIREEAHARNVAVISQERAEQHIRQLVEEWIGDEGRLDRQARDRVEAEGRQWGLTDEVVESIIREASRTRIRQQLWERRVTGMALAAASLAVLFVIGFFSWALLESHLRPGAEPRPPQAKRSTAPPAPPPDSDNAWWDAGLAVAVAKARVEMPQLLSPLGELDAIPPARRAAAYDALVQYLLDQASDDAQRELLQHLLARCYAREPSEEDADRIAAALLQRIPAAGTTLSSEVSHYPKMFWALRTAVAALEQAKDREPRAERMADALSRAVGTPVDRTAPPRETERRCLGGLAERLFRLLISLAAAQPPLASSLFGTISAEAVRYLDENLLDQLTAEFLVALLTSAADQWREYQEQLRELIEIADPAAVIKLVGLYEQTKDVELQGFMSGPLLQRAEVLGEATTVAGIAEAVRRKLGVGAESSERDRWARWSRAANRALEETRSRSATEEPPLEEVVSLAHFATLGCALSREELGLTTFDDLLKKGPPSLDPPAETATPSEPSADSRRGGTYDQVAREVRKLSTPGGMVKRIPPLQSLVAKTEVFPDITYQDAEPLAAYLLSRKMEVEHRKVIELVSPLAKWKHLRIALADRLDGARLERGQLQELLSAILGKPVTLGQGEAGREAVRVELLRSVVGDLNRAVLGSARYHNRYDATRTALGSLYAVQSRLLGIKSDEGLAEARPSQVLKPLIEQYAAQLQAKNADTKAKEDLAGLSRRLKAIEYVAADDLQLTVLLEREWAELLARAVLERQPERKEKIDAVLSQLRSEDRQAKQIVSQLLEGQAALLRLWLLWNQPV